MPGRFLLSGTKTERQNFTRRSSAFGFRPHADPQLPGARRRRDVAPDQGGDLGARLPPPAAALGLGGRSHQIERRRVVERGGLAGRRRRPWRRAGARCRAAWSATSGVFVGSARPAARAAAAIAAAEACTVDSFRVSARSAR